MVDPYSQLLDLRRTEVGARGLAKLPHDFYAATQSYLNDLKRTFESELRENPSGRKGELARQTYQRATQIARDIIESRMTKILSVAFQASVGGASDVPNAASEERSLFQQTVALLRGHRAHLAPYLERADAPAPPVPAPTGGEPAARPSASPEISTSLVYVRVLADHRPIETGGETLDLRKDDVLSVAPETAQRLVEARLAERIVPAAKRAAT